MRQDQCRPRARGRVSRPWNVRSGRSTPACG